MLSTVILRGEYLFIRAIQQPVGRFDNNKYLTSQRGATSTKTSTFWGKKINPNGVFLLINLRSDLS
ncbi:hypothetical protein, partial [Lacticaseibacillus parakribbianus]|uniref:hypothetical protein n=1 Tax=Lacticaseibacillus parakribbianus TaxID=2970927 RepID=UPI0021CB587F